MSRLHTLTQDQATGQTAELFSAIKAAVGKLPNAYAVIGSNSPAILAQALQHNAALKKGSLSAQELEAINLAVSEATGCDYCLAAHTLMAKMAGIGAAEAKQLRQGGLPSHPKLDALAGFARQLVTSSGTLPAERLAELRAAGFSDQQVVEALSAISAIYFTNLINRVNDTVLDFPRAE